jgi:hypothetical protein
MIWEFVLGLVRHGLTFGGGWLVTTGIATETEVETGIGFAISLMGLVWSWYRKWKRENSDA